LPISAKKEGQRRDKRNDLSCIRAIREVCSHVVESSFVASGILLLAGTQDWKKWPYQWRRLYPEHHSRLRSCRYSSACRRRGQRI
jgi:hypothetical protein